MRRLCPAAVAVAFLFPLVASGQTAPTTIDACYVSVTGNVYRIDTPTSPAPGAPKACAAGGVAFTWNQQGLAGPAGPKGDKGDPGSATNLGPDLALTGALTMGKTGTFGGGLLATGTTALTVPSGAGTRLMWVPQKFAVRAGEAVGGEWDAANIGAWSAAFGAKAQASGAGAFAAGGTVTASGSNAVALGLRTTASGANSVALGSNVSTNGKAGAFAFGDNSAAGQVLPTLVAADNEFLVRAAGGVRMRTSSDLTKGCNIDGGGNLSCTGAVTGSGGGVSGLETLTFDDQIDGWDGVGTRKQVSTHSCPAGKRGIAAGVGHQDFNTAAWDVIGSASPLDASLTKWVFTVWNSSHASRSIRMWLTCVNI